MAYDSHLADRIRGVVQGEQGVTEKRMFGGLAFLVNGNVAVSASSTGGMLVRVEPAATASLLDEPQVELFEMGGRSMNGWLHVRPEALAPDEALRSWVDHGVGYARSLPPK